MRSVSASRWSQRPWCVEENGPCFVVRDRSGQALTRVYFSKDEARSQTGRLKFTRDEAMQIATSVANLPELLRAGYGERV